MAEHRVTEEREPVLGPGESKLVPEGNSKARFFVPKEESEPPAVDEPDLRPAGFGSRLRFGLRELVGRLRRS